MYAVEINKKRIPYLTQISIKDNIFYIKFRWNSYDNRVYIDLLDVNKSILVEDEPIVLGQILFARYYIDDAGNMNDKFPKALIVANFNDGNDLSNITFDNIENVSLYINEVDI